MLKKNIIISIIILFIYCITCNFIFSKNEKMSKSLISNNTYIPTQTVTAIKQNNEKNINKESTHDILATLSIPKINLNRNIYYQNNKENNVDKNVTILQGSILPDNDNSIIFLAAHSGNGKNAFFNNIKYLEKNDEITFTYKNKKYIYTVITKREVEKNGYINGTRISNHELILTTCSDKPSKQLIIDSILKNKSNN